jgi:hypothetical protein
MIAVGPWLFPKDGETSSVRWHTKLPPEMQAMIKQMLVVQKSSMLDWGRLWEPFIDSPPLSVNGTMFMLGASKPDLTPKEGWNPMFKSVHPVTGEDYGVYFTLLWPNPGLPPDPVTNLPSLVVTWAKIQPPFRKWYEKVWDFILSIPSRVTDVVKASLDMVGTLACTLLGSSGAKPAAGAVSTYYTGSTQAGSTGVDIGRDSCGQTPPPPEPGGGTENWILPVAIAGGAMLALALILKKKKTTP